MLKPLQLCIAPTEAMESAERQARLEKLRREAETEMRRNLDDSGPPRKRSKRQGETRSATFVHGTACARLRWLQGACELCSFAAGVKQSSPLVLSSAHGGAGSQGLATRAQPWSVDSPVRLCFSSQRRALKA